jgi:basic membrane protein A
MRSRFLRLALALTMTGAVVAGYTLPRHNASAASMKVVTFVTDVGGLNDNGFNHLGYIGTQTGAKAAGWQAKVIETTSPNDYAKNLTTAAQHSNMVVAVGFSFGTALPVVAKQFPKVDFVIIDYSYSPSPKNILGNDFTPEQSSYLAGIVAAGISKTHTIGFVGGLNVPLIGAFLAGFQAGAKSYDPTVKVLAAYTGSFTDQGKGKVAGLQEINQGADVVYPAAGASGLGTLTAAAQKHVWGIGVDADQNYLHPNTVITSVVKHVEVAIAAAIEAAAKGNFHGGTKLWNLANNGVGLAPYHSLAMHVPAKVQAAVAKARSGIISGKIKVPTVPTK